MSIVRRAALVMGAAALALNSACYAYQPVASVPVAAAQRIRLHLTAEGTSELARYLGPRVENVDGSLASLGPDGALNVAVESVQLTDGVRQPWSGEGIVTFPGQYVSRVERSEFSRTRTIIGAIALAAGLFAIAAIALKSTNSQAGPGVDGGSPPP